MSTHLALCHLEGTRMFVKSLIRSVATVTAVGSALAAAQVAAPVGTTVTAQTENAALVTAGDYTDSIPTTTRLTLRRSLGQYGALNRAYVSVTGNSNVLGAPKGRAQVTIANVGTYTGQLSGGKVSFALPRTLRAGKTFTVRARYLRAADSDFKSSGPVVKFYTVMKAITQAAPTVRRTPRGTRPRVNLRVTAGSGIQVNAGRASVRLYKDGHLVRRKVVRVRDGRARATFARVYTRGIWDVNVTYRGTSNFRTNSASTWFRVTRR